MGRVLYFCLLIILPTVLADWEVSVCFGDRVEALDAQGHTINTRPLGMADRSTRPNILALDSLTGQIFLADSRRPNTSIYSLEMEPSPTHESLRPVLHKASRSVTGVAVDLVDRVVYWTTGRQGSILRSVIFDDPESCMVETVHKFSGEVPHGIAVDSCRRKLYWSNCNITRPSIEVSRLDGSDRTVLVNTELFQPLGISLSQGDGWLYWADEKAGYSFTVERVRLDGSGRQTLVRSSHQQPFALAVVPGEWVYWTDPLGQAIWRLDLTGSDFEGSSPELVREYKGSTPTGLIAVKQDSKLDADVCSNVIKLRDEVKTGWSDKRTCPDDFCLHNGTCLVPENVHDPFSCQCTPSYLGSRCQYESRLCSVFCLDSSALADSHLFRLCGCSSVAEVYSEVSKALLGNGSGASAAVTAKTWRLATLCLSAACVALLLITIALAVRTHTLSKRPKLWRRYTVSKKPMNGSRHDNKNATQVRDDHDRAQCEIGDIENCCNMNICETPCYEPEFRTPKKRTSDVEHQSLVSDMEVPEPTGPCLF